MRGCFPVSAYFCKMLSVLPAYAGMFLVPKRLILNICGSPRVCGDVSLMVSRRIQQIRFSPRMRGCFQDLIDTLGRILVLPAYAGMFPSRNPCRPTRQSSPRVCGDVSGSGLRRKTVTRFSPRMRGCFLLVSWVEFYRFVLPAYAGMFPTISCPTFQRACSPRVCGDVSRKNRPLLRSLWFSPRMRGCFLSRPRSAKVSFVLPAYARGCFRVLS